MASVLPPSLVDQPVAHLPVSVFPAEIELVPRALRASIHLHSIDTQDGPLPCWSYLTEGLAAFGQKEVVFTVAAERDADPGRFPTEPLRFASTLLQLASQGRTVDAGAITELGGGGFMMRRGLTYVKALPLAGVPLPAAALAAIPLTAEELAVLKIGGQTRVLAALGAAFHHYPFPPWLDRVRKSVITPESTLGTLLAEVPHLAAPGTVRIEKNTVLFRLRPEAVVLIGRALGELPPGAGFALTTEIDAEADGCLIWQVGQESPSAIAPPGSRGERLGGCFVLFAPDQPEDGGQIVEDGMAMSLTTASMAALRRALAAGQTLALPGAGGKMGFLLSWAATRPRDFDA
ncbi:MAG: hypothetical protein ABI193_21960 [Minicystis sp.]